MSKLRRLYYKVTDFLPAVYKARLDNTIMSDEWRGVLFARVRVYFKRFKRGCVDNPFKPVLIFLILVYIFSILNCAMGLVF